MLSKKSSLSSDLNVFLTIIATLILIGCLFVYSSSSVYALETFGTSFFFVKRQLQALCIGMFALYIGLNLPINFIRKMATFSFICSLFLVSLTLLPSLSRTIHGSSRWISIMGFSFQPSELLKITLLFYLAYFLERKTIKGKIGFMHAASFCILISTMCILLLKQPEFGLTITLLLTTIILFFCTHTQIKHIVITLFGLALGALLLILFWPYRLQRILTFLNPWQDPKGAGFQIIQSFIAIGSGSWLGTGIAHSRQKLFYLPMQHTDFIFSIIAEETGFIGCIFLLTLFILLLYFGIRIAHQFRNIFNTLVTLGFIIIIHLQAIINMAVVTGLAPTKGIGMPFISYGNTSLVCYLFMIGVIMNMVHNNTTSSQ
ncbi:MAG TPA: putative lipid II flippase FtsW [Candidatus Babeliales bacterium]|nr:putative lipid II flippase FtsW [Candidatus Babeliales bacterium]